MDISIVNVEPMQAISIRDHCSPERLSEKYKEIYKELGEIMKKHSLKYASHPFGIYHAFSSQDVDVEAGIPVTGIPQPEGRMQVIQTYEGKAVCLKFYGDYSKLADGWNALTKYLDENNIKASGPCFEVYVTDPETEPDHNKWLTEIYCPLV